MTSCCRDDGARLVDDLLLSIAAAALARGLPKKAVRLNVCPLLDALASVKSAAVSPTCSTAHAHKEYGLIQWSTIQR